MSFFISSGISQGFERFSRIFLAFFRIKGFDEVDSGGGVDNSFTGSDAVD